MLKHFMPIFTLLLVLLLVVGCSNPAEGRPHGEREITSTDTLRVMLIPGVSSADLGLSNEEKLNRLTAPRARSLGRSVTGNEPAPLTEEQVFEVLRRSIESASVPDFERLEPEDIERIRSDFLGIEDEQLAANIEQIRAIYMDQLAALTLNQLRDSLLESSQSELQRSAAYEDGAFNFGTSQLTLWEIAIMSAYPMSALRLSMSRDKAFNLVETYLGCEPDLTNEKSDAFRHSVWVQTLAMMGSGIKKDKLGWASLFSAAHEQGMKYDLSGSLSSAMDLHNNSVGLAHYKAETTKKYSWFFGMKYESGVNEQTYSELSRDMKPKAMSAVLVDREAGTDAEGHAQISASVDQLVHIKPDTKVYQ